MKAAIGIFRSQANAEQVMEQLREHGISDEHIHELIPSTSHEELTHLPTSDTKQPGMGRPLGGIVGGAIGAYGGLVSSGAVSVLIPGVGPVLAVGLVGAALFGAVGAATGVAIGEALDHNAEDLSQEELVIYEEALSQGHTMVIAMVADPAKAATAQTMMEQAGAESFKALQEKWWQGLRAAEAEAYSAQGGDFTKDEAVFWRGFEAALQLAIPNASYDEAVEQLQTHYTEVYDAAAFRRGFERGRAYQARLQPKPWGRLPYVLPRKEETA
jgi:hypothetical protein